MVNLDFYNEADSSSIYTITEDCEVANMCKTALVTYTGLKVKEMKQNARALGWYRDVPNIN